MSKTCVAAVVCAVAVGLVAGCGGGAAEQKPVSNAPAAKSTEPPPALQAEPAPPAEPTDPGDRIIVKMRGWKDDVCACPDAACVEGAEKQMMDWAMANIDELKDIKPTQAQEAEADRIEDEMEACKARHASTPPSSPPVPKVALKPLPPGGTGVPACDEYIRTIDTLFATCHAKLGPAIDAMVEGRNAAVDAFAEWGKLDAKSRKAAREAAENGCTAATDAIRQTATALECSP